MIDTSNARKVVKRFISYVSDIASHDDEEYRKSRLSELVQFINENLAILEGAHDPDVSKSISDFIGRISDSGFKLDTDTIELLLKIDPENISIGEYHAGILLSGEDYEGAINIITADTAFCASENAMGILSQSAIKSGKLRPSTVFYSRCGKYDEGLFSEYLEVDINEETNDEIISNYKESAQYGNLSAFLTSLIRVSPKNAYKVELAKAYLSQGDEENLRDSVNRIDLISVERTDLLLDLARIFEHLEDYDAALNAATIALRSEPANTDFLGVKARSLQKLGRNEESLESYERIAEKVPSDAAAVRSAVNLSYSLEKYQDTLKYLNLLKDIEEYSLDDLHKSIDTKIKLSMFDEASRDVSKALEIDERNIDTLRYRFKLEMLLHDENDAYNTAVKILEINPEDLECLKYRMNYLYDRGESEAFLERFEKITNEEVRNEFKSRSLSCLINLDRFEEASQDFMESPDLLNHDEVLDALFYNIRTDEEIKTVIDAMKKTSFEDFPLVMLILYKIQGKKCTVDQAVMDALEECKSPAIAHIIAMETIDFNSKTIPDHTKHILSRTRFKQTSDLVDVIFDIYSGKYDEDIQDSPRLLYPISNSLILNGDYDHARDSLRISRDSRKTDPFYYYFESLIDYYKGETGSARKNLSRARADLTNVLFLGLELRMDLSEEDEEEALETIERILEMKEPQAINFRIIHNYIFSKDRHEFASNVLEVLSKYGIENIWVKRIVRDDCIFRGDLDGAEKASQAIVGESGIDLDDVRKHADILSRIDRAEKRVNFLIDSRKKVEDPQIDIWIGDYYYGKNDYDTSLEYYRDAVSKGTEPLNIQNYVDTLIETENYEDAEKLIKKLPEGGGILLVKLYHRTGNINRIVDLIRNLEVRTKEEEEQISYISRILWMNREVRDALTGIYESEGYLFLGKILAQRMMDSHEYRKAVEVMRNLQKNYPDDIDNIKSLSDALAQTGEINDAINVLVKVMKQVKDPAQATDVFTRLLRLYYEDGDYRAVTKHFELNRDFVNETSLQYVIRSYMAEGDFDSADKLIGKYEGSLLGKEIHKELQQELATKQEFQEVLKYVVRILKLEYKAGKKFDMNEALYKADVPMEMIEKVFDFLRSDEYYVDINEEKYELLSRDIIQSIVKRSKVSSIDDVNISIIFNNLDSKDPVIAKNLYIYIRRNIEKEREPGVHNEKLERLLKAALREKVTPEPLRLAFALGIGISEAMDVLTLMDYMSKINKQGGF